MHNITLTAYSRCMNANYVNCKGFDIIHISDETRFSIIYAESRYFRYPVGAGINIYTKYVCIVKEQNEYIYLDHHY